MADKKIVLYKRMELKRIGLIILLIIILMFIINLISNSSITGLIIGNIINFENLDCREFKENILWSSGYSSKSQGSINYQIWHPEHNCIEMNISNCFLENIEIKTRFLYFEDDNETREGYIQISEPDESICNNPEKGDYLQYLSYNKLEGESNSFESYCGKNKKTKERCESETSTYRNYANCYGIKAYGSQYMLADALEIKYQLCWEREGEK